MATLFTPRSAIDVIIPSIVRYWDEEYPTAPPHLMADAVTEWLYFNDYDRYEVIAPILREPRTWAMAEDRVRRIAFTFGWPEIDSMVDIPEEIRLEIMLQALHEILVNRLDAERGPGHELETCFLIEITESSIEIVGMSP